MSEINRKRPRKHNFSRFRAKAKRYSKDGCFGRGTNIEDNDFNYFINVLDSMKKGFENIEEKEIMARNVLEETKGKETFLASNQVVSKALESLVGFGDDETLERYLNEFLKDLRPLCSDPFASHVLQKLLEIALLRAVIVDKASSNNEADETNVDLMEESTYNLMKDFKVEHRKKCSDFVLRVGKFLLNNLEDFVFDNYANHILRTAIYCLAGIHVPKKAFQKGNKDSIKNSKHFDIEPEWHEVVTEYGQRLSMWPQLPELPYAELTSALLGVLCTALHRVDKKTLKRFGKKLTEAFLKVDDKKGNDDNGNDDDDTKTDDGPKEKKPKLPKVFCNIASVNLLETLLNVAGPKVFTQLYVLLFSGNLERLALERETNFAVQRLIDNVREKTEIEEIIETLSPHIEKLLLAGNTGIMSAMSAACLRLSTKQAAFITAMQKALHIEKDQTRMKLFLKCLLKLKPYEVVCDNNEDRFIHLHGSLIVQHMLQFNRPILIVNCILETPADQLYMILQTPNGSHIANAFLESKYIGEKSREKLIRYLENFYIDLAITKFGSRVLECLFSAAQEAQQLRIVKALSEKENQLTTTLFGRLLEKKFMLQTYRLSPGQWKASYQKKKDGKKLVANLFKEIIN